MLVNLCPKVCKFGKKFYQQMKAYFAKFVEIYKAAEINLLNAKKINFVEKL